MKKYITTLLTFLLVGAGIAHAQCVSYSLSYAVYATEALGSVQAGQGGPVPGMGAVTIGGSEQSIQTCRRWLAGGDCQTWLTKYDSGTVSITVNGFSKSTAYAQGSTPSLIATALANAFNADNTSPVKSSATGNVVYLTSKASGVGTNYSLSSASSTKDLADFGGASFDASPSGSSLSGGAATSTGADLLTSVLVDGSASMTLNSATCPYPIYQNLLLQLPTATHTPQVTSTTNGVGGFSGGTPVCVNCYLSYQANQDTGFFPIGTPISFNFDGAVDCSEEGIIWDSGNSHLQVEVAYTRAVSLGTQSNCYWNTKIGQEICDIDAQYWCTPATTVPDYPVNAVATQVYPPPVATWWETFGVCVAYGSPGNYRPWFCLPKAFAWDEYTPTPPPAQCTYNP